MSPQSPRNVDDVTLMSAIRRELILARTMGEPVVATWWLVASNVLFYVVAFFYGFVLTDNWGLSADYYMPVQMVFYTGMKVNHLIVAGDWWRFVSNMWVHLGLMHIGFNVYGLYVLGPLLEKFYGWKRFFILYLSTGIVASWASYTFNDIDSGGASGALYGLVGALLVFGWKNRDVLPDRVSRAFTVGMAPWVVLSIGIGFFEAIPFDNAAHLGGLLSGAVLALVLGSKIRRRTERVGAIALWVGSIVGIVIVALTAWFWSAETSHCLASRDAYLQCYPKLEERVLPKK